MNAKVSTATRLGFVEQLRRPILIVLLIGLPFFFITRAIAETVADPRILALPGGGEVLSNMRDIHGADMAGITIAFLAGLCGLFIVQSAREADRRLVVAGFTPLEAVVPRLLVLASATALVVTVSVAVTALSFEPRQWLPFAAANVLIGLTYAGLGGLAGGAMGQLGGAYFMFFMPMIDLGIAQNPMFGDSDPDAWATWLPGYGATRMLVDASFSDSFHAWGELVIALAWALGALAALGLVLRRQVGTPHRLRRQASPPS